ncbi:MAG: hypothetical protein F4230_07145, partial [Holophagales bacterium]|nr:hypothetical protein [Holophagales bacterium]
MSGSDPVGAAELPEAGASRRMPAGTPAHPVFAPVSTVGRRRWAAFKANRRGYWSLGIFLVIFGATLFAEVLANDKPLVVRHEGRFYFPIVATYAETEFGGVFETEADYREPFVKDLIRDGGG